MGTTCTAVVLVDGELFYGHVGDSRLYLIRGGAISQLSQDHSRVARLVREGALTPEEAAGHPDRNVLTAALGMASPAHGDLPGDFPQAPVPLESGDLLLICTDGLHGLVSDEEMRQAARPDKIRAPTIPHPIPQRLPGRPDTQPPFRRGRELWCA
jgi:serine/threonine protein phosphatase PrpC